MGEKELTGQMTERFGRLNLILAGVLAVILLAAVVVLIGGNKVLPWATASEQRADSYDDVKAAADEAVTAFLDVDYRDMDSRMKTVDGNSAVVLVAADVVVTNKSTVSQKKTKSCPHEGSRCDEYRFVVHLDKSGGEWKMSELAGVS